MTIIKTTHLYLRTVSLSNYLKVYINETLKCNTKYNFNLLLNDKTHDYETRNVCMYISTKKKGMFLIFFIICKYSRLKSSTYRQKSGQIGCMLQERTIFLFIYQTT